MEIDPVQVRSSLNVSKFLSKPRAVTYQIDCIVECRLLDVKYGGMSPVLSAAEAASVFCLNTAVQDVSELKLPSYFIRIDIVRTTKHPTVPV